MITKKQIIIIMIIIVIITEIGVNERSRIVFASDSYADFARCYSSDFR